MYSFSDAERKELKDVLMTEEQEESSDEENSSESSDELDSIDDSLFLDKAYTDLRQKLGSRPKQLIEFWNKEEQVVNVRDYLVPQSLAPILESLFEKYGDVGAETNLSPRVKMYLIVILCGTIDSMCCARILDITEDKLLNWWQYSTALESTGFKIQFVHDQGTRVTKAYFGLRLRKLEDDTLQELETDITKYDAEVKEMTTKLERIKDQHKRITSEKYGNRSSLIKDCLRMAAKLKWKRAGAGLIKLG